MIQIGQRLLRGCGFGGFFGFALTAAKLFAIKFNNCFKPARMVRPCSR